MNFGEKLKKLRERREISQAQMAKEISHRFPDFSMSQAYISSLENRPSNPRDDLLQLLALYFDVPVTYFSQEVKDKTAKTGVDVAKELLEELRKEEFTNSNSYASSYGFQTENDEVNRSLRNLDDDEYIDF